MAPLRLHGYLDRPGYYPIEPLAIGVGPDDIAVAAWPPPAGEHGVVVMRYDGKAPYSQEPGRTQVLPAVTVLEVQTSLKVTHVQPLPGGKVLLVSARTRGSDNAEVWDGNGQREHAGLIGDAVEHLLTTPSGAIWAGYFDEGIYGPTPAAHGLARFALT